MKKFLKSNKIAILSFLILCIWGIGSGIKANQFVTETRQEFNQIIKVCHSEEADETLKKHVCPTVQDVTEVKKPSTGFVFFWMIINTNLYLLQFIGPLFIMIPACYHFYKKYRSGAYRNFLVREKYFDYIKKELKGAYKNIWIFPAFLLVLFLISYLISGHFDGSDTVNSLFNTYRAAEVDHIIHFIPFFFLYGWNLIMLSILFVSISLFWIRKSLNFAVHIVLSMITYLGIQIVLNSIFVKIYEFLFHSSHGLLIFNLNQYWGYEMPVPLYKELTFFIFALAMISVIVVVRIYNSKERVILDVERKMG